MLAFSAILIFLSVGLTAFYFLAPRENVVRRRLLQTPSNETFVEEDGLEGGPFKRLIWPTLSRMAYRASRFLPQNIVAGVEQTLIAAGSGITVGGFFAFWFTMIGFSFLMWLAIIRVKADMAPLQIVVLGCIMVGFGGFAPYYLLRRRARKRRRAIERGLPDALDLLLTSVEAGLAVDAAFALVTEHYQGPLGEVFSGYLRQVGLGQARRDALNDVAERTGVNSLVKLAHTVAQATEVGTSMGDVLRVMAADMRTERRLKAQEAAQRAPVLMVIPLATCFLPAMVTVVIVPSVLNLLRFVNHVGGR